MAAKRRLSPLYGSLPAAAHRFGLGLKLLRRKARERAFPVYDADTSRPRVCFAEVEAWLRSTRVPAEPSAKEHAESVVTTVLAREEDSTSG